MVERAEVLLTSVLTYELTSLTSHFCFINELFVPTYLLILTNFFFFCCEIQSGPNG
jgi:hypothetical protein